MYKKLLFTISILIIVAIGSYFVIRINYKKGDIQVKNETEISEKVTDECTEEYEKSIEETEKTSSEEKKISPNCEMILKKYFKGCEHTTNVYIDMPEEIVNMTKSEIEEKYSDWKVEEFSSNKLVLYKEIDGSCGEHYEVKADNSKVIVYNILDSGDKVIYEITGISTEYLTNEDKTKLEEGIKVNGTENLNKLLEDFE